MISLYYTFVYPYLNYCIHVWGKAYNTHLKNLLVLRIVTGVPPRTSVHQIYIEQNILPVKRLYNYNVALFMYKHSNDMLPSLFDDFFCKVSDIHHHNTRKSSSQHLYISFRNTTRGQKMFSYCGATIWNFILNEIDPNCSIGLFKKQIRHIFLLSSEDVLKKVDI